jgi:hypothetical protein
VDRNIVRCLKAKADLAIFDPQYGDFDQDVEAIRRADYNHFLAFPCQDQHDKNLHCHE